ncbi:MAG: hypothetical protein AAGH15_21655, partial [Myxococcota bacterium]
VFENPFPFPVRIQTKAREGRLYVHLEGAGARPHTVETEQVRVLPAGVERVPDARLAPGEEVVERAPRDGQVVRVVVTAPDGTRTRRLVRYGRQAMTLRVATAELPPGDEAAPAPLAGPGEEAVGGVLALLVDSARR